MTEFDDRRTIICLWNPDRWSPSGSELEYWTQTTMAAITAKERPRATWTTTLGGAVATMHRGQSLHHIDPVSVGRRAPEKLTAKELVETSRRLLDPGNMFVVPRSLAGLGEIDVFIDLMRGA